ncbi:tetratricopeptide repeat protein [Desulfovibrio ferrophilus]|uniref:Uncharacterized protein n=1 Tax=Desulfovibrio ferrophilus TaxID=241368 RepID=A0A2Z6AWX3_9BACT|nr:hypothetical protein [Desulfovibrio ferrophilus]BBD07720.1 uncharacterized protein DFE_0994 [Desulfovibrio ferrophilus]
MKRIKLLAFIFATVIVACNLTIAAELPSYTITVPNGWKDNANLGNDMLRQITDPGNNSMVEIYYGTESPDTLQALAEKWESTARKRGIPYMKNLNSSEFFDYPGTEVRALRRKYSGQHGDVVLGCQIDFMKYDGFIVIVVGIYPQNHPVYREPLLKALASFQPGKKMPEMAQPPQSFPVDTLDMDMVLRANSNMEPAFNVKMPDSWQVSLASSSSIKIVNPDVKFNFLGIDLSYTENVLEDEKVYLELLGNNLSDQFEMQFAGFKPGEMNVYLMENTPVLFYTFKYSIPGTDDEQGNAKQWNFIIRDRFLVTLFYTAPEFLTTPYEEDILPNVFASFELKPAWLNFADGLDAYFAGDYEVAEILFKKSLETEKNNTWLWYYTGLSIQAVHGLNQLEFSSDCFAKSATLDPRNIKALNQLSACFMTINDYQQAHEILADALKIDPFDEETLLNRTKLFLKEKNGDLALATITTLLSKHPENEEAIMIREKLIHLKNQAM